MKIAYVTTYDSSDLHRWSGSGTYIRRALEICGFQIDVIGNLEDKHSFTLEIKEALYTRILSKGYRRDRDPTLLRNYAAQVARALPAIHCDVVFSPGTIPIAYLQTEKPIVFWTDATFAGMIDFYPDFSNLCDETIKNGNKMEQLALSKCRIAIYTSEWAANTAIENYDVDPAKIKVVPFGANLNCNRNKLEIDAIIKNKKFDMCKLLFVGVDWVRKGGDIAIEVADLLSRRGIRTELHIVGCHPELSLPSFVKLHPFISKTTTKGRKLLDALYAESHFLILPSRADCVPVVIAEASSFGLPSLATRVGGIPTAIRDGKNGQTFLLDDSPQKYCDCIERFMSSRQEYNEFCLSSFREYSETLNWLSAGRKVHDLIHEVCG